MWRHSVSPIFDCRLPAPDEARNFSVRATVYDLGNVLFARSSAQALHFERSSQLIRQGGIDHFLIQWYRRGGYMGDHANDRVTLEAGQIGVLDLGREFRTRTRGALFDNCNVFVPRSLLLPRLRRCRDPKSLRLSADSVLGRVLTNHLETTWREIPRASAAEATSVAESIVDIVATCLDAGDPVEDLFDGLDKPGGRAMRDFIESNLESHSLGPDLMCATFRCSRTYLYRMFRSEGGLVRYIQTRRLQRIHDELTGFPASPATISELAYKWGFSGHSHLCRKFRAQFGITPSDARELGRCNAALRNSLEPAIRGGTDGSPLYHDWLRQMGTN